MQVPRTTSTRSWRGARAVLLPWDQSSRWGHPILYQWNRCLSWQAQLLRTTFINRWTWNPFYRSLHADDGQLTTHRHPQEVRDISDLSSSPILTSSFTEVRGCQHIKRIYCSKGASTEYTISPSLHTSSSGTSIWRRPQDILVAYKSLMTRITNVRVSCLLPDRWDYTLLYKSKPQWTGHSISAMKCGHSRVPIGMWYRYCECYQSFSWAFLIVAFRLGERYYDDI